MLILTAGMSVAAPARAGVASFVEGCLASVEDLTGLEARPVGSGMTEIDPSEGPSFPAMPQVPERRRLWRSPPSAPGEAYTGYLPPGPDAPIEICWHVSRPGESATIALEALRRRFPPADGTSPTRGRAMFYGGSEQWETDIGGIRVTLGVDWAFAAQPDIGVAMLYVAKLRRPG